MEQSIQSKLHTVKRELILDAASTLFDSVGFEKLKVSELANEVGVSVGTIYSMFESKEGIFLAHVQREVNTYLSHLQEAFKNIQKPQERLKIMIMQKYIHFVHKRDSISDSAHSNLFFFNNINPAVDILSEVYAIVTEVIQEINPLLTSKQAEKCTFVIMGLSDGYINHWLHVNDDLLATVEVTLQQSLTIIKGFE